MWTWAWPTRNWASSGPCTRYSDDAAVVAVVAVCCVDMGVTYEELGVFGALRKVQ